jgi:small conductance mechanosensitive channel
LSLLALLVLVWALPVGAQTEVPPTETVEAPSEDEPTEEDVDLLSDVEQLLRYERVKELDQAKLESVRRELDVQQALFEELGSLTYELTGELDEKRKEFEELDEDADLETRSALEAEISDLEAEVEFYKRQSDLELTTESTLRKQIASLEKKLERQQRAIDTLRGVEPTLPKPVTSTETEKPEEAAGGRPALIPGAPAASEAVVVPAPAPKPRLETTAQVEAQRDLDRRLADVEVAEKALVEYVKRRESLREQIEFETVLLETTQRSVENLESALQYVEGELAEKSEADDDIAGIRDLERSAERLTEALEMRRGWIEERQDYLESLQERMEIQQKEEGLVTSELEERRREVKKAQERLYWLESPIHPSNVARWFRERGPRILFVIVVTAVLLFLLRVSARTIARATVRKRRGERSLTVNRADTLALSFRSAATVLILIGGTILVFQEAGIDVKTVLGGAAILGLALAFGAQNLMRDYFTGFMILLEDQYELGDLVTIGTVTGRVEKVNMRTTMLRDLEGRVHFIPNGEVKSVTNRSYVWGRAVIDVPISYKENVDRAMDVLLEVAEELRADPEFGPFVTDEPVMLGVDKFTEYGVVIKFMLKTLPDKPFPVRRQMLRRVKNKFDEVGIEISVPYRMLLQPSGDKPVET